MTPRDFAYWLQGFFEIAGTDELTPDQVRMIKDHLNLVFYHAVEENRIMSCGTSGRIHGWVDDYSHLHSGSSGESMTCGTTGYSQGDGKPVIGMPEDSHVIKQPQFLQEHLDYHEIPNDLQHK